MYTTSTTLTQANEKSIHNRYSIPQTTSLAYRGEYTGFSSAGTNKLADAPELKNQEEQKITKDKVKELIENVDYAQLIHGTFLTPAKELQKIHPESFLIYKPKNTISGDLYKVGKKKNKIALVLGDSTGHGVSSSYISVIALSALSRVMGACYNNPAKALQGVNRDINRMSCPDGDRQLIETTDMIAAVYDKDTMVLTYASAKMKAFILRNGEVIELKKDLISMGEQTNSRFYMENNKIKVEKGDQLYLFSDGAFDQFGGEKNKRMGYKVMKGILKNISHEPMAAQQQLFENELKRWQGTNEQTDDISILSIKC